MSVDVEHILPDGSIEAHSQLVERMLRQWNLQGDDMFDSEQARLREAYRLQGDLIAYVEDSSAEREGHAVSQVREKPN